MPAFTERERGKIPREPIVYVEFFRTVVLAIIMCGFGFWIGYNHNQRQVPRPSPLVHPRPIRSFLQRPNGESGIQALSPAYRSIPTL